MTPTYDDFGEPSSAIQRLWRRSILDHSRHQMRAHWLDRGFLSVSENPTRSTDGNYVINILLTQVPGLLVWECAVLALIRHRIQTIPRPWRRPHPQPEASITLVAAPFCQPELPGRLLFRQHVCTHRRCFR